LLWGHVGIAPMSMSTTTMSRIIPMDIWVSPVIYDGMRWTGETAA